jgi:hypothetical protein
VLAVALLLGALVWLAAGRSPTWPGWLLLAAGVLALAPALWR